MFHDGALREWKLLFGKQQIMFQSILNCEILYAKLTVEQVRSYLGGLILQYLGG